MLIYDYFHRNDYLHAKAIIKAAQDIKITPIYCNFVGHGCVHFLKGSQVFSLLLTYKQSRSELNKMIRLQRRKSPRILNSVVGLHLNAHYKMITKIINKNNLYHHLNEVNKKLIEHVKIKENTKSIINHKKNIPMNND